MHTHGAQALSETVKLRHAFACLCHSDAITLVKQAPKAIANQIRQWYS